MSTKCIEFTHFLSLTQKWIVTRKATKNYNFSHEYSEQILSLAGFHILSEDFVKTPKSSHKSNESKALKTTYTRKYIALENKPVIKFAKLKH